jgi:hypothetical protein
VERIHADNLVVGINPAKVANRLIQHAVIDRSHVVGIRLGPCTD